MVISARRFFFVPFCLAVISQVCTLAAPASDPVLSIWAKSATKNWIGTGFLINDRGKFLTCYHVVRGASQLTVYQDKNAYGDVQVVAIAPEYDLAILELTNFPNPGPFLRLSDVPPSRYFGEELKVHGNPNGLSGNQLDAKLTKPDYVPSGEFRTTDGHSNPIFRSPKVNLIPLSMTIFNGLSGGPVVSKAGVVGVLSGSFNEGGTIAWAIPIMYASPSQMTSIQRPVSQMTRWPELSLMDENAVNTLRFEVSISAGLSLALDSYVSGVDDFAGKAQDGMVNRLHDLAQLLSEAIDAVHLAQSSKRKQMKKANARLKSVIARSVTTKQAIQKQVESMIQGSTVLSSRLQILRSEVESFQKSLPDTPKNRANIAKADESMTTVSLNLIVGAAELVSLSHAYVDKLKDLESRFGKVQTLNDVGQLLMEEKQIIQDASDHHAQQLAGILMSFRQIGGVAESLLASNE